MMGRTFCADGVNLSFSLFDTRFPAETSRSSRRAAVWNNCGLKEVGSMLKSELSSLFSTSTSASTFASTATSTAASTAASTSTSTSTSLSSINYVGLDFGDTVTVGACGISPVVNLKNLSVKKLHLYQPFIRYRETLEVMKTPKICEAEKLIIKKGAISLVDYLDYIHSWSSASSILIPFYSQLKHRHMRADRKKKKRAVENIVVDGLLKLGGGSMGQKVNEKHSPICFAVGLGDFATVSGLPSLHTAFKGHFVKIVRYIFLPLFSLFTFLDFIYSIYLFLSLFTLLI